MNENIEKIEERNRRVEADKAWETSVTRRLLISLLTYLVAVVWLCLLKESQAFLKALVPVVGFILSTITLAPVKKIWITKYFKS